MRKAYPVLTAIIAVLLTTAAFGRTRVVPLIGEDCPAGGNPIAIFFDDDDDGVWDYVSVLECDNSITGGALGFPPHAKIGAIMPPAGGVYAEALPDAVTTSGTLMAASIRSTATDEEMCRVEHFVGGPVTTTCGAALE